MKKCIYKLSNDNKHAYDLVNISTYGDFVDLVYDLAVNVFSNIDIEEDDIKSLRDLFEEIIEINNLNEEKAEYVRKFVNYILLCVNIGVAEV